jgi:hypothetical protein
MKHVAKPGSALLMMMMLLLLLLPAMASLPVHVAPSPQPSEGQPSRPASAK